MNINSKNKNILILVGVVILIVLVSYFVFIRPEPADQDPVEDPAVIKDPAAQDFPVLFEDRDDLLFEERITKLVSELKRSPAAHFSIVIQGTVKDFFDRTLVVEARGEQIQVPIAEGAIVVTEVRPEIPISEELPELPPEEFMLFELLMLIEMAIEQKLLPDAPLAEVKTEIEARLPKDAVEEEMPGFFAPPEIGEPVREPFNLEDIRVGDFVVIQARITPIGELTAFEVLVTPMSI